MKKYICAVCEHELDVCESENKVNVVRVYHCEKCFRGFSRFYFEHGRECTEQSIMLKQREANYVDTN